MHNALQKSDGYSQLPMNDLVLPSMRGKKHHSIKFLILLAGTVIYKSCIFSKRLEVLEIGLCEMVQMKGHKVWFVGK